MFKSKKDKLDKETLENELNNIELTEDNPAADRDDAAKTEAVIKDAKAHKEKENRKIKELEAQNAALKDQLLRKAAEFENYKRRTENEISNIYRLANENLIIDLLPVLEDFNRVVNQWDESHDIETFKKGVELVYSKFGKVLEKQGLKAIESIGKPFDVNLNDAIMQMENGELDPETIIDEVEKGYFLKDKVIKHSKVVVSKKPE